MFYNVHKRQDYRLRITARWEKIKKICRASKMAKLVKELADKPGNQTVESEN